MSTLSFPRDFVWGVATSSYQIEGAVANDGRSPSIWDVFSHTPGKTRNGDTGDVACDHYSRWPADVALMRDLGIRAYRFSIAWPRILPESSGKVNQAGLDFYGRLVDSLLEAGVEPYVTLFHWDLPAWVQERGGWPERFSTQAFAEYAQVVSRHLGDRVRYWITHNEPWCASMLSHQIGEHAPGWQNWNAALRAAHHLLLSHGMAVNTIRSNCADAEVGITLNFEPAFPASPSAADYHAARLQEGYFSRWFLDPVYGRRYPADMVVHYEQQGYLPNGLDFVQAGDMELIAAPTDFLGVNYYTRRVSRDDEAVDNLPPTVFQAPKEEWTEMDWEIHPQALYHLLNRLHFEYQVPRIYITENGCSFSDGPDSAGVIQDQRRIDYLHDHLHAVHRSIANGAPVAGYFVWSLMDNFEWAHGYSQRFGLVWVDYDTLARIPKQSAFWYRAVIERNGLESAT